MCHLATSWRPKSECMRPARHKESLEHDGTTTSQPGCLCPIGPIARRLTGLPVADGCDTARDRTRICSDAFDRCATREAVPSSLLVLPTTINLLMMEMTGRGLSSVINKKYLPTVSIGVLRILKPIHPSNTVSGGKRRGGDVLFHHIQGSNSCQTHTQTPHNEAQTGRENLL
jgi:hypothetical protein